MDHEGRFVQQPHRATINDHSGMIDLYEIGGLDQRESNAERIDPEGGWINRISMNWLNAVLSDELA